MKDFFIVDAAKFENAAVTRYFVLSSLRSATRSRAANILALTLTDKTGSFEARMWDDFADAMATCAEGCYVKVQGQVSKYQGKFQITLTEAAQRRRLRDRHRRLPPHHPIRHRRDVGRTPRLRRRLQQRGPHAASSSPSSTTPPIGPAYRAAPAAKRLHHAWIGGLLEHVLTLVRVCLATAPFYPEVDPDLLVTGAILHDIGKVRELSWGTSFNYTLEGQMIGHISIAQGMLREKIAGPRPTFPTSSASSSST